MQNKCVLSYTMLDTGLFFFFSGTHNGHIEPTGKYLKTY